MPGTPHARHATILTQLATAAARAWVRSLSPFGKIRHHIHTSEGVDTETREYTAARGEGGGGIPGGAPWSPGSRRGGLHTSYGAGRALVMWGPGRRGKGSAAHPPSLIQTVDTGCRCLRPRASTSATRRMAGGLDASGGRAADGDDGSAAAGVVCAAAVAAAGPTVEPHSFAQDGPPAASPPSSPRPASPPPPASSRKVGGGCRPGTQRATQGSRGARGAERRSRNATNSSGAYVTCTL